MIRFDTTIRFGFFLAFMWVCVTQSDAEAYQCDWSFSDQVQYDTGENATGVDAADLNGDGKIDLVVANRVTSDVVVLAGDGSGAFAVISTVPIGWQYYCEDLTEDQCTDDFLGEWGGPGTVCEEVECSGRSGTGRSGTPLRSRSIDRGALGACCFYAGGTPRYVETGDLDGDGDIDAATPNFDSNTVSILLNDGKGTLTVQEEYSFLRPSCIAVKDLDGDGDVDIIVPHWDPAAEGTGSQSPGLVSILLNNGNTTFEEVIVSLQIGDINNGIQPRGIAVGDLDGDGDLDFAVSNLSSRDVTIVENLGCGKFESVATLTHQDPPANQPRYIDIGDLDQDGLNDLAVVSKNNNILWIIHNDGGMQFSWSTEDKYPTAPTPHSVAIADLNGDCKLDVIVSHVGANFVYVYENDGQGHMAAPLQVSSTGGPAHVIAADVNGDWNPDLITANTNNGSVNVFINQSCCLGDIDGDGEVGVADILKIIDVWGDTGCIEDLNGDGIVNVADLLIVVSTWGSCP